MNLYITPIDGTYDYKSPNFDGTYNMQQVTTSCSSKPLPREAHKPHEQRLNGN